jgi:hypothetical protein
MEFMGIYHLLWAPTDRIGSLYRKPKAEILFNLRQKIQRKKSDLQTCESQLIFFTLYGDDSNAKKMQSQQPTKNHHISRWETDHR